MARSLRARQGDHEEELAELQRRFNALGASRRPPPPWNAPPCHAPAPAPAAVAKQNAESHPALLTKGLTQRGEKVERKRRDDPVAMAEINRLDDQACTPPP
jgi:hypothetical protein